MPISLTRDEFLERLAERNKLFVTAIKHDLKQFERPPSSPIVYVKYDGGEIEVHEFIGKVVTDCLFRAVDLVYQENLE